MQDSLGLTLIALRTTGGHEPIGSMAAVGGGDGLNPQRWVSVDDETVHVVTSDLRTQSGSTPWEETIGVSPLDWVCKFRAVQVFPGALPAPQGAGGLLMSSLNVPSNLEDEFNDWCTQEHVTRLAQVPGVFSARRYRTQVGKQRYVNLYHLESPEVQASEAWKVAINTPWSARLRPFFTDKLRIVARPLVAA